MKYYFNTKYFVADCIALAIVGALFTFCDSALPSVVFGIAYTVAAYAHIKSK